MGKINGVGLEDLGDPNAEPGSKAWAMYVSNEIRKSLYDASRSTVHLETSVNLFKQYNGWQAFGYLTWDEFCHDRLQKEPDEIEITITMRRRTQIEATSPKALNAHGVKSSPDNCKDTEYGNKADYLTARIARDRPDILKKMQDGEYRSVRAAAIDAGIIDPSQSPLQVNRDPGKAGRYFAQRVDREWFESMIDSYYRHIED